MVKAIFQKVFDVFGLLALLILINIAASYFYTRFDFTKEKRYTLSNQTKTILKQNQDKVVITVFLNGELPSAFRRLQQATKDLLADYQSYTKADVKIVFIDPIAGLNLTEQDTVLSNLADMGIKPVAINLKTDAGLTQKIIFPLALLEMNEKSMPINLLQKSGGAAVNYEDNITSSIQNLEYEFSSALQTLLKGEYPTIGFTEGHGEPSNLDYYDAITSLSQRYIVGRVDLKLINQEGLDRLKLLFVANPQSALTEAEKYKINYFVMKGGRVVWLIDQVEANLKTLQDGKAHIALNRSLNIDDMLFEYGVRINYNLLADANCALIPIATGMPGQGQIELVPWLFDPILMPDTSSSVSKNIDGLRAQFVSTLDTIATPNVKKQIILRSSPYYKVYEAPRALSLQLLSEATRLQQWNNDTRNAGVLLEGVFKSVFIDRPLPEGIPVAYELPNPIKPTKMIVIGDGDIFSNQVNQTDQSPFPLGFDRYSQQNYGNKALLLNIADYLTNDANLMALRNKEVKLRLLDKNLLRVEKSKWQLINLALPLLLLIFFAIFQHYYRKHRYAK